jgi:hypothetical protein
MVTPSRVTSRTESSHSELKSYLHTSTGDLKTVVDNIELMIGNKKDEFEAKLTRVTGSIKTKFRHPLLKDLVNFITPPALELVREQIRLADAAAVERERSGDVGKPCTNRFTTQYGLPCWHVIRSRRRSNTGLVLDDFDKHWHFVNPIVPEIDPILTIEEPVIRPHRDRPWGARNQPVPFPDEEQQNTQSHDTSTRYEPSHWELAPPTRGGGRNQRGSTNREGSTDRGSTRGSARGGRGNSTPGGRQPHTNTAQAGGMESMIHVWQLS